MSAVLEWVVLYTWTHKLLTHIERVKCSERKTSSSSSYVSFHILLLYLSFFHHCLIYCCICFRIFIFLFLVLLSPHSCFLQCFSTTITSITPPPPPPPPPTLHRSPHVGVISCFSLQCFLPLVLLHIWPSLSVPRILYYFFYLSFSLVLLR